MEITLKQLLDLQKHISNINSCFFVCRTGTRLIDSDWEALHKAFGEIEDILGSIAEKSDASSKLDAIEKAIPGFKGTAFSVHKDALPPEFFEDIKNQQGKPFDPFYKSCCPPEE